jgi:hypothetical protein
MKLTLTCVIPPLEPVHIERCEHVTGGHLPVLPMISSTVAYTISAESILFVLLGVIINNTDLLHDTPIMH